MILTLREMKLIDLGMIESEGKIGVPNFSDGRGTGFVKDKSPMGAASGNQSRFDICEHVTVPRTDID